MDVSQNEEIQTETKNIEKLETISEEESEPKSKTENTKAKKRAKKPRTKKQVEAFQKMIKKRKENLESKKKAKETKADDGEKPNLSKGSPKGVLLGRSPNTTATDNIPPKVEEIPKKKPKPKTEPQPEEKPQPKPQPKQEEKPKAKQPVESDTQSDTDTDSESEDEPLTKKQGAKMKVFTHDNVRRQVNRPNLSNREYQSGYSRETIEKAKQELKRNRTNKSKMTRRNNIANRRFDSSIFQ